MIGFPTILAYDFVFTIFIRQGFHAHHPPNSIRSLFAQTTSASDLIEGGIDTSSSTSLTASSAVVIGLLSNLNQQIQEMTVEDEFIMLL